MEKEKKILLSFAKATKEYPVLRQPHYTINLAPNQTKFRKNFGTRKKRKSKKHSSHKTKGKPSVELDHDQENTGHYVSKIVVDDATHCLKLRVKSCKKSQEAKENTAERTRSRKAKQPRRYNRDLETLTEHINGDGAENPNVVRLLMIRAKFARTDLTDYSFLPNGLVSMLTQFSIISSDRNYIPLIPTFSRTELLLVYFRLNNKVVIQFYCVQIPLSV